MEGFFNGLFDGRPQTGHNTNMTSNPLPTWLKFSLEVPKELAEPAAQFLAGLAGGVEYGFRSAETAVELETLSIYTDPKQERETAAAITSFLKELQAGGWDLSRVSVSSELLEDRDWNAEWKKRFRPLAVTPRLVIKPSWETYEPAGDEAILELDPGMAFGTGHHASTRLALMLLDEVFKEHRPATVLDVGCGTGILAMAAALWGAKRVSAIDNDPQAVKVTLENLRLNRLDKRVTASTTTLSDVTETFGVVVANIIHETLLAMASDLVRLTAPGGWLILAGILGGQQEQTLVQAYARLGMVLERTLDHEEWVALRFRKD